MNIFGARRPQIYAPPPVGGQIYFQDGMANASNGQALTARTADTFGSYRLEVNMPVYNIDFTNRIQSNAQSLNHKFEFIPEVGRTPGSDAFRIECWLALSNAVTAGQARMLGWASTDDILEAQTRIGPLFDYNSGQRRLRLLLWDDSNTVHTLYTESSSVNNRRVVLEVKALSDSSFQVWMSVNEVTVIDSQTFNHSIANRGNRMHANLIDNITADGARLGVNTGANANNAILWSDDLQVLV